LVVGVLPEVCSLVRKATHDSGGAEELAPDRQEELRTKQVFVSFSRVAQ